MRQKNLRYAYVEINPPLMLNEKYQPAGNPQKIGVPGWKRKLLNLK